MTILVTGAAGFIGSNFIMQWEGKSSEQIIGLDTFGYAADTDAANRIHAPIVTGDISDRAVVGRLLRQHEVRAVVNFAAQTHVDRSLSDGTSFLTANCVGTFHLLEECREYWQGLGDDEKTGFRFLQVSTDEVFGSLDDKDPPFEVSCPYRPSSPYSASKAAADHFVRAAGVSFGLPILITHCTNNYGPYQFPEKLIPVVVARALSGEPIPIYGDGGNRRDWIHVRDHCCGIEAILAKGAPGKSYNIGAGCERSNMELAQQICVILDSIRPNDGPHARLIAHVADRPGHDFRYALDTSSTATDVGWTASIPLSEGLEETVRWYCDNEHWLARGLPC